MTKLILVRHALTVDNQNNRLSGHIDSVVVVRLEKNK